MARIVEKHHLLEAMRTGQRFDGATFGLRPFLPAILQASFDSAVATRAANNRYISVQDFERMSDDTRRSAMYGMDTAESQMPTLTPQTLISALSEAAAIIEDLDFQRNTVQRTMMRAGLQIVGVRIVADDSRDNIIRLSNARLPFSLRLIGCHIAEPMALNSMELVTLDLSGSSIAGLDATFLVARGSVRLRRAFVMAPVDFGGARIHGFFDASDLVVKPFWRIPQSQSFDGDRGVLNLSQATIDNDVRLDRAMVWGGLAMRGLKTERSLFLDEAMVTAPMAVLEAMAAVRVASLSPVEFAQADKDYSAGGARLRTLAALVVPPATAKPKAYTDKYYDLMASNASAYTNFFIEQGTATWQSTALNSLLTDRLRVRTSAIRADGARIGGSIFATNLTCNGRFRMKYASVAGGLTLAGARLRSIEASRRSFDELEPLVRVVRQANVPQRPRALQSVFDQLQSLSEFRRLTYNAVVEESDRSQDQLATGADRYALDLRESRFGGSIRLGERAEDGASKTVIDGEIAADRIRVDGEFIADNCEFIWSIRLTCPDPDRRRLFDAEEHRRLTKDCTDDHEDRIRNGKVHALSIRNGTIADRVSLAGVSGLQGADFSGARLGDLAFFSDYDSNAVHIPACKLSGIVDLTGVMVTRDCRLLFDPVTGPHLLAEFANFGGELAIVSPGGGRVKDPAALVAAIDALDKVEKLWEQQAALGDWAWRNQVREERKSFARIRLSNARATVFSHPPTAWPRRGQLEILGFRYERTGELGPLNPFQGLPANSLGKQDKRRYRRQRLLLPLAIFGGGALLIVAGFGLWAPAIAPRCGRLVVLLGTWNLAAAGGLLTFLGIYRLLPLVTKPHDAQSRPMALIWLQLQRMERNAYRTHERLASRIWRAISLGREPRHANLYRALDPYVVAAKALREDGRWNSANMVERERARAQTGQLSWRLHLFSKTGLKLAEWLTSSGFSFARAGFVGLLLVVLASAVVHNSIVTGVLVAKSGGPAQTVGCNDAEICLAAQSAGRSSRPVGANPASKSRELQRGRRTNTAPTLACSVSTAHNDGMVDFAYAIDTVFPAAAMGETENWEPNQACDRPIGLPFLSPRLNALRLLHLLGLAVFGVIIVGLTSRVGTLLSRYQQ